MPPSRMWFAFDRDPDAVDPSVGDPSASDPGLDEGGSRIILLLLEIDASIRSSDRKWTRAKVNRALEGDGHAQFTPPNALPGPATERIGHEPCRGRLAAGRRRRRTQRSVRRGHNAAGTANRGDCSRPANRSDRRPND